MGCTWSGKDRSLKDPTWLPGCCLLGEDMLLGMASWRRILWVCRGAYTRISCRRRSPRVTNCLSYVSCCTESWWITNRANKTSMLQAASLPLFLQDVFNQHMQILGASVQKTEGKKENYTVSVLATYAISLAYSTQSLCSVLFYIRRPSEVWLCSKIV